MGSEGQIMKRLTPAEKIKIHQAKIKAWLRENVYSKRDSRIDEESDRQRKRLNQKRRRRIK